jgi:hypothetical protein
VLRCGEHTLGNRTDGMCQQAFRQKKKAAEAAHLNSIWKTAAC